MAAKPSFLPNCPPTSLSASSIRSISSSQEFTFSAFVASAVFRLDCNCVALAACNFGRSCSWGGRWVVTAAQQFALRRTGAAVLLPANPLLLLSWARNVLGTRQTHAYQADCIPKYRNSLKGLRSVSILHQHCIIWNSSIASQFWMPNLSPPILSWGGHNQTYKSSLGAPWVILCSHHVNLLGEHAWFTFCVWAIWAWCGRSCLVNKCYIGNVVSHVLHTIVLGIRPLSVPFLLRTSGFSQTSWLV